MSIHDRQYTQDDYGGGMPTHGNMMWGLPRLTPAVKWLLIINAATFIVQYFLDGNMLISTLFGVSVERFWAFWTYLTFQFLHGGVWHILLNMLGVYFLGTTLENMWGSKPFLRFYLGCGAAAGLLYVIIGAITQTNPAAILIGASGGVFGLLLACAVYCPQFRLVFFVFPVPIRPAAVVIFGLMLISVLNAAVNGAIDSVMSNVAHLGGAFAAAFRIWAWPVMREKKSDSRLNGSNKGAWKRRMAAAAGEEREVDRILQKIQREGIGSLNDKERKTLQNATKRQRETDRRINDTFKNR